MKSIRPFLNEVQYSGKYNYHYVTIYYWDNVSKELKPVPYNRYMTATKDYFSFTWMNDKGYEIQIPFHRVLRVTEYQSENVFNTKEKTIWERTEKLNSLMMVKAISFKVL